MEVPLPICFSILRKRVDGSGADNRYHCVPMRGRSTGTVGWQDGSPNCIRILDTISLASVRLAVRQLFRRAPDGVHLG